ncbi:superoxide dismutase [Herbivorax sp. ANBcel31]|uniref:superoxide dismutase n=1 Tax=Herbivorax sp. ANBcel31 TaxID=3069754 RepID=UPI0027AE3051|nr:superoxide dismutase [Herbivorax sp. ANBcel31]MDQ2088059.1 superoxide dismutase [Herbivorax sp. ANBcel31]
MIFTNLLFRRLILVQQYIKVPVGEHKLPSLPYNYNALEPVISSYALTIHHTKHHKSYVDGLNKAEIELEKSRKENDFSLVKHWERELAFNGSGHILHSIYWTTMAPFGRGSNLGYNTLNQINISFGSFSSFQKQFTQAAIDVEASGWAVLAWNPAWHRLEILTAEKHQNLTQWGSIPILVIDSWEHAYYIDYQNRRSDYVKNWWQLVNWCEVERKLILASKCKSPLTINSYQ